MFLQMLLLLIRFKLFCKSGVINIRYNFVVLSEIGTKREIVYHLYTLFKWEISSLLYCIVCIIRNLDFFTFLNVFFVSDNVCN